MFRNIVVLYAIKRNAAVCFRILNTSLILTLFTILSVCSLRKQRGIASNRTKRFYTPMSTIYSVAELATFWEIAAHSVDHMFSLYFDYL